MRKVVFVREPRNTRGYRLKSLSDICSISVRPTQGKSRRVAVGDSVTLEEIENFRAGHSNITVQVNEK